MVGESDHVKEGIRKFLDYEHWFNSYWFFRHDSTLYMGVIQLFVMAPAVVKISESVSCASRGWHLRLVPCSPDPSYATVQE